ncbi:MAG TPA: hypothetical protein VH520_13805 [Streptosporangiaceae bacterium]|jgi:hypothetical protein
MIQTILIVLVAVVVLIVIIAVLALRYLRADDSDTFDQMPDEPRPARRPADQGRERLPAAPGRRSRQPEQVTEVWAADRPARTPDNRATSGFRDRDTEARATGPQRAATQGTARRETAGSRPVRASARPDGPESATSSWDSLSDVDYWAELAADKPEITPAAGGPAAASRHGSDPASDIRPVAARPAGRGDRADSGQLPVRRRHQPSRPGQPSRLVGAPSMRVADAGQTEQIDVRAAQAGPTRVNGDAAAASTDGMGRRGPSRHGNGQRPDAPAAQQHQRPAGAQRPAGPRQAQPALGAQAALGAQPAYQSRPQAPAAPPYPTNGHGNGVDDNDPLTSPSFPAINASDSRSYRTRRSGGASQGASGQHTRPPASQDATSHQYIDYSSAPRRTASRPDGYPAQPAAHAAEHQSPTAPAANPYGSYVSQPQPAYSEAAAAHSGYPASQQASSAGWYAAQAVATGGQHAAVQPLGQPADGYLPSAGIGGTGMNGGSHAVNGSAARGYAGIDYSSIRYDDPVYPDTQGYPPGYGSAGRPTAQHDQQGYGTLDPSSGQDGYEAYRGYGTGGR